MTFAIQTFELTKQYPRTDSWPGLFWRQYDPPAVNRVNLAVHAGEVFGLVGPNGAGKTTFVKMLATLILPTSGSAQVNGFDLADEINVKRSVGLVTSDERSFYWRLTGQQNLEFFAALDGYTGREAHLRVSRALERVGLSQVAGKRFQTYSTGMRQRLSIARALLSDVRVLFLDEPTRGLDPAATHRLHELIREQLVAQQGITVVMTSHRLEEVERLCDRVAIMTQGEIRVCGTMETLRGMIDPWERYHLKIQGRISPSVGEEFQRKLLDFQMQFIDGETSVQFRAARRTNSLDQVIDSLREEGYQIVEISRQVSSLDVIFERVLRGEVCEFNDDQPARVTVAEDSCQQQDGSRKRGFFVEFAQVARAFLIRDLRSEMSYRVSFLLQFFNILFSVVSFYFVAQLFGEGVVSHLEPYGGDFFSFVLIGIAFGGYFGVGLSGFSNSLRRAQTTGTLEAMLSTPTRLSTIILSSSLWSYLLTTLRVVVYLLLGLLFFGVDLRQGNYGLAFLILILAVISFSSLGIIAASFIMVLKRGNPVTLVFGAMSTLLGGVYYPITVMPAWLQQLSNLVPMTFALRSMRLALLKGASFSSVLSDVLALVGFSLVLLPLSLALFRYAVKRAKSDGSLTHY